MGNNNVANKETESRTSLGAGAHSKFFITLNTVTWKKESYGLFDYESKNYVNRDQIKIYAPTLIIRDKDEIKAIKEKTAEFENCHVLAEITHKNGEFFLEAQNYDLLPQANPIITTKKSKKPEENNESCLWSIIKNLKDNLPIKYRLNKRDCIKMGRIKMRIRDFKSDLIKAPITTIKEAYKSKEDISNQISCRICLVDEAATDNPFVSPCDCSGTMKYVHIKCLQKWLKNRLKTTSRPLCSSIEWKPLDCELCQSHFSDYLMGPDGVMYETVEIPKPDNDYLVLELLNKETNAIEIIQIINMATKNVIKIGRGVDTDLRINDISVSRIHAFIKLENGVFFLEDNSSKFGSLILINKPIMLNKTNNNIELQSGRTVLRFNVKKKQISGFGCFGTNKVEKKSSLSPERNKPNELSHPVEYKKNEMFSLPIASEQNELPFNLNNNLNLNLNHNQIILNNNIDEVVIHPNAEIHEPIGIINFNDSDEEV